MFGLVNILFLLYVWFSQYPVSTVCLCWTLRKAIYVTPYFVKIFLSIRLKYVKMSPVNNWEIKFAQSIIIQTGQLSFLQIYKSCCDVLSVYLHAFTVPAYVKHSAHMWTVRTEWLMEGNKENTLEGECNS